MNSSNRARVEFLGQTGVRIDINDSIILIDPYLSNSVQTLDSPDLVRQVEIPYNPSSLTSVSWVLITHDHLDHCDPFTLPCIADASPSARFMGPLSVRRKLIEWNISPKRVYSLPKSEFLLADQLRVLPIPSAHPTLRYDQYGQPISVGYVLRYLQNSLYVAGDTSVCDVLLKLLKNIGPLDIAMLPVNEDNYFRRRRGIVGNMSVREAFGLASEVGISALIPVHWDMFSANSTSPDEIKAVYDAYTWPFKLLPALPFYL